MVGQTIRDGKIDHPGTPHYVHQGEWVEFMPVVSMADLFFLMKGLSPATGEVETMDAMMERISARCEWLANQVVAWNWTGLTGMPLEQPYHRTDVLMGLSNDELMWLIAQSQETETEGDRKNA